MTLKCAQSSEYSGGLVKIPIARPTPRVSHVAGGEVSRFTFLTSPHNVMLWSEPHFIN